MLAPQHQGIKVSQSGAYGTGRNPKQASTWPCASATEPLWTSPALGSASAMRARGLDWVAKAG